jgi:hypothetical protein
VHTRRVWEACTTKLAHARAIAGSAPVMRP